MVDDGKTASMQRAGVEKLCSELQIFTLSAEIHGGAKGLYDLGPHGCAIVNNLVSEFRKHFIHAEEMLEIRSAILTPESVLKASGHVDRFHDLMVRDAVTGDAMRADHLLEEHLDELLKDDSLSADARAAAELHRAKADAYDAEELHKILTEYGVKSNKGQTDGKPNDITKPFEFKLMFETQFGPSSKYKCYLRPETAQGMFVNFKKLYDYNMGKMPFAAAQIGLSFRNEISPRNGLIRLREFLQMEIEHFFNPEQPNHENFEAVKDLQCLFFSGKAQLSRADPVTCTIGEAVKTGLVCNQTLGYFLARTWLYLERVGIDKARMRFRQHLPTEMAHYAKDCWDAEILIFDDWVECVGIADRGCHDLSEHIRVTNKQLYAQETYDKPRMVEVLQVRPDYKLLNKAIAEAGASPETKKAVFQYFKNLKGDCASTLAQKLKDAEAGGKVTLKGSDLGGKSQDFTVTPDMVKITSKQQKVTVNKYIPCVVEPAFGLSRILYALMAHSFGGRSDDVNKVVLKLRPTIAPASVAVLPLSNTDELKKMATKIHRSLRERGVSSTTDQSSAAIGRRYVRMDKQGVPFVVTIDFDSLKDGTVTLRDRDTCAQVRLPQDVDLVNLLTDLATERTKWSDMTAKFPMAKEAAEQ